jgi:hypothetical protein
MPSFGSAAFTSEGRLVSTFEANFETLPEASGKLPAPVRVAAGEKVKGIEPPASVVAITSFQRSERES